MEVKKFQLELDGLQEKEVGRKVRETPADLRPGPAGMDGARPMLEDSSFFCCNTSKLFLKNI